MVTLTSNTARTAQSAHPGSPSATPARKQSFRIGQIVEPIFRYFLYAVIVIIFLVPFIWMFFGSLRREIEIQGYMFPFGWHTIVPVEWTLQSYSGVRES